MPTPEEIQLACLNKELNLTPAKLGVVLKLYSSVALAIEDEFKLFLSQFKKMRKIKRGYLEKNDNIFFDKEQENLNLNELKNLKGLWIKKIENMEWMSLKDKFEIMENDISKNEVKIIAHENFPECWQNLTDCPVQMFYQGNINRLQDSLMLTVVGSRQTTKYTELLLSNILKEIAQARITIVSGLALGVDSLAHKLTVDESGFCIAAIGSGLNNEDFYPTQNLNLKRDIIEKDGLVLSEYPPGVRATTFTFPKRNRFLASLSKLTWVVQASLRSGSLITARLALEYGNTVATTPASIYDKNFEGNLKLLKEGANIISQNHDILDLLGLQQYNLQIPKSTEVQIINSELKLIYDTLSINPISIQDLHLKINTPISKLITQLSMLELDNLALNIGENLWVKNTP